MNRIHHLSQPSPAPALHAFDAREQAGEIFDLKALDKLSEYQRQVLTEDVFNSRKNGFKYFAPEANGELFRFRIGTGAMYYVMNKHCHDNGSQLIDWLRYEELTCKMFFTGVRKVEKFTVRGRFIISFLIPERTMIELAAIMEFERTAWSLIQPKLSDCVDAVKKVLKAVAKVQPLAVAQLSSLYPNETGIFRKIDRFPRVMMYEDLRIPLASFTEQHSTPPLTFYER